MEKRKDLLLDVDDVICFSGFIEAINEFMDTNYKMDDFSVYYIDEVAIPKEKFDDFSRFIRGRNFYDDAQILPGAIETIGLLNELYNIYPCSSCINPFDEGEPGDSFKNKFEFLRRVLPFIKPENIIFTSSKHLIRTNIQIDDKLSNFNNYAETKILFPSYHNKKISDEELRKQGVIRAGYDWRDGWREVEKILVPDPKIYTLKK